MLGYEAIMGYEIRLLWLVRLTSSPVNNFGGNPELIFQPINKFTKLIFE
jgi:hypothetical protein